MKKYIVTGFVCLSLAGCGGSGPNGSREPAAGNSNTAAEPMRSEKLQSTTEHTTENQTPPVKSDEIATGNAKSKWPQSGDPIDTAKFDDGIAQAEKTLKAKPADDAEKKTLAQAYFDRGFALTEARQYASALGDYRRALKHDPSHEESKKWIDRIVLIYGTLKKAYPKEGEEPPPLPYKKSEKGEK